MYSPHDLLMIALEGYITTDALKFLLRRLNAFSIGVLYLHYFCSFPHGRNIINKGKGTWMEKNDLSGK